MKDCKFKLEMGTKGCGERGMFVNQSLIFSLLAAEVGKKIKIPRFNVQNQSVCMWLLDEEFGLLKNS